MTAELSILNKSGVVLAADSAVTIGRNNKVFNSATKLFKLSAFHPVGIMVYNSATWMGIPIEIIIKQYNSSLGQKSFTELKDYALSFISFLRDKFFDKFNDGLIDELIRHRFVDMLEGLVDVTKTNINDGLEDGSISTPKSTNEEENLFNKTFIQFVKIIAESKLELQLLPEFEDYKLSEFKKKFHKILGKTVGGFYSTYKVKRTSYTTASLYKLLFYELVYPFSDFEDYTGLVIAGYGDDQIFPALTELKLGEVFSNRLRYEITRDREISHDQNALVIPFAQRDMVDTFFQGIDPTLLEKIENEVETILQNLSHTIVEDYQGDKKSDLKNKFVKAHRLIGERIYKLRDQIHVNPVITSVSYLPKEDLIELAESLVNITSLKRKTSNDLHSVGGPVDIALISKGDGFVWIKRKEKINLEINGLKA